MLGRYTTGPRLLAQQSEDTTALVALSTATARFFSHGRLKPQARWRTAAKPAEAGLETTGPVLARGGGLCGRKAT